MPVRIVDELRSSGTGYIAKVPRRSCQGSGPRGGPLIGTWRLPIRGGRSAGLPVMLMRRSTGATDRRGGRPATATGLRPRGAAGELGQMVPDPSIRMNLISTISNEGSVHFMTYKETMTARTVLLRS